MKNKRSRPLIFNLNIVALTLKEKSYMIKSQSMLLQVDLGSLIENKIKDLKKACCMIEYM